MNDYEIDDNGIIVSPGKFEGEMQWVPYFWEISMDGEGFTNEHGEIVIDILASDIKKFPALAGYSMITISEDNNGITYGILDEPE